MILKKHYLNIWLRIIGILINCLAIAFVVTSGHDWFYLINLFLLLAIQVFMLVRSQNIINKQLEQLFDSLDSSDTSTSFLNRKKNLQFQKIHEKFDILISNIHDLKLDSIQKNEYLTTLFEHINIGIISISNNDVIHMINSSAKKILGKGNLTNINDVINIDKALGNTLKEIKPDESKLVSIYHDGYLQHLSIRAAILKFQKEEIKIVSFQNIRGELDEREMEGWQKLIRVLTHELMNSVGPINSTISTIMELLSENSQSSHNVVEISPEVLDDAIKGLKIIEERSKGMMDFVSRFRSLTLIPNPVFSVIDMDSLINNLLVLMQDQAERAGINLINKSSNINLKVHADRGMIEQIMINLLKNSFDALIDSKNPIVNISVWTDNINYVFIDIANNGKGIPQNIHDKIFVPFFTTRKNGTGIGLSLSRQLANVQGGALALTKSTTEETIFTLKIKKY